MPTRMSRGGRPRTAHRRHNRWWIVGGAITGFACAVAVVAIAWWPNLADLGGGENPPGQVGGAPTDAPEPIWDRPAVTPDGLTARSGVSITQVAVTGNGGLVDLRFQVLDANAANALHDPALPPAIIDEPTGLVVRDLVMNHSHTGQFHQGGTYYLVFENPGNWIGKGSSVTVLLGPVEVRNITVE